MIIHISNCQSCPFCNNDNEYGYDRCNLKDITMEGFEQMPSDKRHEDCPLSENNFKVIAS